MSVFSLRLPLLFLLSLLLGGCGLVEGIFKAGMWVGILAVVVVIALIVFLVRKAGR